MSRTPQTDRCEFSTPSGSGLGSVWSNDPSEGLIGILLNTDAFASPFPPPAGIQDFWTGAYTALDN